MSSYSSISNKTRDDDVWRVFLKCTDSELEELCSIWWEARGLSPSAYVMVNTLESTIYNFMGDKPFLEAMIKEKCFDVSITHERVLKKRVAKYLGAIYMDQTLAGE